MSKVQAMSREQAASCLGVSPYASLEEIKKAYREKAKMYHPDNTFQSKTAQEYFYYVQQAYEILLANPIPTVRPVRIFQTNQKAKTQFSRQKQVEKDRELLQQWEEKKRKEHWKEQQKEKKKVPEMTEEEEILQKIKAIWLAETIHRQMKEDKQKAEIENKRKLYRAFMQHQMQEENKKNGID